MQIDVFDFDGTIYDGDSTVDFIGYAVKRHPSVLPGLAAALIRSAFLGVSGQFSLSAFKSNLFSALAKRMDLCREAECFWSDKKTRGKIGRWFLERKKELPVVIASASPDFELAPAARMLGTDALICTRCDPSTGAVIGGNCKSAEKIRRIGEKIGDFEVRSMYTDDVRADGPLLAIAREKYLVVHGEVRRIEEQ